MKKLINTLKSSLAKFLSGAIFTATLLTTTVSAETDSYIRDLETSSDYAKSSIEKLANSQIISGDKNGNFNPFKTVTRAEMVKMIVNARNIDTSNIPDTPTFSDVPLNHWAYKYIEAAVRENIIKGVSANTFGVNQECTREEMATIFVRSMGVSESDLIGQQPYLYSKNLDDLGNISSWAKEYVEFALSTNIMKGIDDDSFGAKRPAQRQQVAVVTDRFITNNTAINAFSRTFTGDFSNPELYLALTENNERYKGNLDLTMEMSFSDALDTENSMTFINKITGVFDINSSTGTMKSDANYDLTLADVNQVPLMSQSFKMISLGNSYYIKYEDMVEWIEITEEDLDVFESDALTPNQSFNLGQFYRYSSITKEENVAFKGDTATKYTLLLDKKAIETLSASFIERQLGATPSEIGKIAITSDQVEVYLNAQNQLISETESISGSYYDAESESTVNFSILVDAYYYNIGQDVQINAPVQ